MATQRDEQKKTRPDLDDQAFVIWLSQQPENKGVPVPELYRKMLVWCTMKGVTASRKRLLRWIAAEREAAPMTYVPPDFDPATGKTDPAPIAAAAAEPQPCETCGKSICLADHRYDDAKK